MPVIAFDGNESDAGRALLCLSALYHCADQLRDVSVRLIDVADANVLLAVEALTWDIGVKVDVWPVERAASDGSPLADVSLYAGIACGSARHMRLEEAHRLQIPTLLAMQFPEEEWLFPAVAMRPDAAVMSRHDAAFDPGVFAAAVVRTADRLMGEPVCATDDAVGRAYALVREAGEAVAGAVPGCPDAPLDVWLASGLVDVEWYRATNPDVAEAGVDPVWHYFTHGWRDGRDPNAWFATRWYLDRNPDLKAADESPLHHFVRQGAHAGCRPHPDFDIAWYSREHLGLEHPSHVALRHFLVVGEKDGNAIAPPEQVEQKELLEALVDPDWYHASYPDLAEDTDPTGHYFESGWREGRDPNAWFATRWYLDQNPTLKAAEESPLHHFVREGARAGCRPHPDFDISWYSRQRLGLEHPGPEALRHFLTIGLAANDVPTGDLDHRRLRTWLSRLSPAGPAGRSGLLKGLLRFARAAADGRRWDEAEAEFWPLLLANGAREGCTPVLVVYDEESEASLASARLVGSALAMQEWPLFGLFEGGHRLRISNRLVDPGSTVILDLPEQITGLRHVAQGLHVGRAVVTADRLRHGAPVRWLRDAGVPVFLDGLETDATGTPED